MVKHSSLDVIFSALSDPIRRAILTRLTQGEASVTELAAPFDKSLPGISKHIRILEDAGLIVRQKEGRTHYLRLVATPMQEASEWLNHYRQFWDERFNALARYLEEEAADDSADSRD